MIVSFNRLESWSLGKEGRRVDGTGWDQIIPRLVVPVLAWKALDIYQRVGVDARRRFKLLV